MLERGVMLLINYYKTKVLEGEEKRLFCAQDNSGAATYFNGNLVSGKLSSAAIISQDFRENPAYFIL